MYQMLKDVIEIVGKIYRGFSTMHDRADKELANALLLDIFEVCVSMQRVVNRGRQIIDHMDYICTAHLVFANHGTVGHLSALLYDQFMGIDVVRESIVRLDDELLILNPTAHYNIKELFDIKWRSLTPIFRATQRHYEKILASPQLPNLRVDIPNLSVDIAPGKAITSMENSDLSDIRASIAVYLAEQDPVRQLDSLQNSINQISEIIKEHVTLKDILVHSQHKKKKQPHQAP